MKNQKTNIIIYVSGGVVQGIRSNDPDIGVEVFDADDLLAEGLTGDAIDKRWDNVIKSHPHLIY